MKFWKILNSLIEETLPDWRDKFLSYKDLKKQLKLIYPKDDDTHKMPDKRPRLDSDPNVDASYCPPELSKEVDDFVRLLEDEIDKFNGFFVDKEEEYVIRWKVISFFLLLLYLEKTSTCWIVNFFGIWETCLLICGVLDFKRFLILKIEEIIVFVLKIWELKKCAFLRRWGFWGIFLFAAFMSRTWRVVFLIRSW